MNATYQRNVITLTVCPRCGSDDLQTWADDGESPDADYWECHCGADGAFVREDDPLLTVNGIRLPTRHPFKSDGGPSGACIVDVSDGQECGYTHDTDWVHGDD